MEGARACWEEVQLFSLIPPPLFPRVHAHHFHGLPGLHPRGQHCCSRMSRNRPHKLETEKRTEDNSGGGPRPSQIPAPSHSLQVAKQGARASSPLTQSQNQHHSYRISPEPLKVTHACPFLSQPTPWPGCLGSQPGMEQKPRSTVLNLMVLSVTLSCQGFSDSSRESGQIHLRGQQFPVVLQHVRDIEERGQGSPTTDSAFQTGSGNLTTSSFCAQYLTI